MRALIAFSIFFHQYWTFAFAFTVANLFFLISCLIFAYNRIYFLIDTFNFLFYEDWVIWSINWLIFNIIILFVFTSYLHILRRLILLFWTNLLFLLLIRLNNTFFILGWFKIVNDIFCFVLHQFALRVPVKTILVSNFLQRADWLLSVYLIFVNLWLTISIELILFKIRDPKIFLAWRW